MSETGREQWWGFGICKPSSAAVRRMAAMLAYTRTTGQSSCEASWISVKKPVVVTGLPVMSLVLEVLVYTIPVEQQAS
jgi:hypothetical protein